LCSLKSGKSEREALWLEIFMLLLDYKRMVIEIQFCWIPAHNSKKALKKTIVEIQVQLGRGEMKTFILKNGLDCWQRQWGESSDGRNVYSTRKSVREVVSYNGNRREDVLLCWMRLGHNLSLKLIGKHGTRMCNGCMVEETFENVLLLCEMYDVE
jgi:hypothetical protein